MGGMRVLVGPRNAACRLQVPVQMVLVVLALASVPVLLLGTPLYLCCQRRRRKTGHPPVRLGTGRGARMGQGVWWHGLTGPMSLCSRWRRQSRSRCWRGRRPATPSMPPRRTWRAGGTAPTPR